MLSFNVQTLTDRMMAKAINFFPIQAKNWTISTKTRTPGKNGFTYYWLRKTSFVRTLLSHQAGDDTREITLNIKIVLVSVI